MRKPKHDIFIYELKRPDQDIEIDDEQLKCYNYKRIADRAIQEFQGTASAIIYDGVIDDNEIAFMRQWIEKHREYCDQWPLSQLQSLLQEILADGIVTLGERKQLLDFLSSIAETTPDAQAVVTDIFTKDVTPTFRDNTFLFTGKLQFGSRQKAQDEVIKRGGNCINHYNPQKVDYLVVGQLGQEAWKFSRFGRKIESCFNDIKDGKTNASIIREKTFVGAIINQ